MANILLSIFKILLALFAVFLVLGVWLCISEHVDRARSALRQKEAQERQAERDQQAILSADPALEYVCQACTHTNPGLLDFCEFCGQSGWIVPMHPAPDGLGIYVVWPWSLVEGRRKYANPEIVTAEQIAVLTWKPEAGVELSGPFDTHEAAEYFIQHPAISVHMAEHDARSAESRFWATCSGD